MEGPTVAIYLDFENLAISAESVYPSQDKPLAIEPIVDFATAKGEISVKKAYADWSKDLFRQYQGRLLEQGFELVHLPETNSQGKNGSDVHLAVDVMEYAFMFKQVEVIIIGSGDTDFIPLIQRLKARGKEVIVLGFEHSVGKLVKRNSAEFKSLEELIGKPEEDLISPLTKDDGNLAHARNLLLRYLQNRPDEGPVLMAKLKQQLLRLDPGFSEKELGFSSFKAFVRSFVGDLVDRIEIAKTNLPWVYFYLVEEKPKRNPEDQARENAVIFLSKKLRYQNDRTKRAMISEALLVGLTKQAPMSMNQMFEFVHHYLGQQIPKTDIKKYINTLFTGGAFKAFEQKNNGPLLSRPFELKEEIQHSERLDEIYIQRVSEILQSRYTDLEDQEILDLLF
ncbi:MAG: NYN domain-containing protein [Bacteroidota bacterium]